MSFNYMGTVEDAIEATAIDLFGDKPNVPYVIQDAIEYYKQSGGILDAALGLRYRDKIIA